MLRGPKDPIRMALRIWRAAVAQQDLLAGERGENHLAFLVQAQSLPTTSGPAERSLIHALDVIMGDR